MVRLNQAIENEILIALNAEIQQADQIKVAWALQRVTQRLHAARVISLQGLNAIEQKVDQRADHLRQRYETT